MNAHARSDLSASTRRSQLLAVTTLCASATVTSMTLLSSVHV